MVVWFLLFAVAISSQSAVSAAVPSPSDVVQHVNSYRAMHGAQPVTYDTGAPSTGSQIWADYMVTIGNLRHDASTPYGENIAVGWNTDWRTLVDYWYSEVMLYDYENAQYSPETGHFTQLVWNKTKRIGMGVATNVKNGALFIVMRYDPPGNYLNEFKENVFRPVRTTGPPPKLASPSPPSKLAPILASPSPSPPPKLAPILEPPSPLPPPLPKLAPILASPSPSPPPKLAPTSVSPSPPPPRPRPRSTPPFKRPPFPPFGKKQPKPPMPLPLPYNMTCNCTC